ncbi:hypothetical protein IDH44_23300 [Paenibacillus sp. IB182496]|uniref:Chloramphenicol acetyltransferase n=1 Tax=Paenibacillus sabuli TaxID=2772509 RepID=A0A927BYL2_9BACL|nr:CatA-like O-acetyltransferase [Paenibacillus sabuli]MBD2848135.1 hypothetical protein [Paenibacillus sabuli]
MRSEGCEGHGKGSGFRLPDEPPNTFPVSSIPWVNFMAFHLHLYDEGTFLRPIFTMGRFDRSRGAVLLPLTAQLHHAVCDGYHAGVLFRELQARADSCADWLDG